VWLSGQSSGWHEGPAGPSRGCEDQRQNLIAFEFGNAHPPAKNAGRVGQPPEKGRPQALKRGDKGTLIGTAEAVPFPVASPQSHRGHAPIEIYGLQLKVKQAERRVEWGTVASRHAGIVARARLASLGGADEGVRPYMCIDASRLRLFEAQG
jgi:hypothetical protein